MPDPFHDTDWFLTSLRRDSAAFVEAIGSGPLDEPVPACPGWTRRDLASHLGNVQAFWGGIVRERVQERPTERPELADPPDDELLTWFRGHSRALIETLSSTPPATPVWTWAEDDQTAGFVLRRQVQEVAVHLWDAQSGAAGSQPIEPVLAADGVDEFLDRMLDDRVADAAPIGGSVHLHATDPELGSDGGGEWWLEQGAEAYVVERDHRKGDAALRGPASDLLLALWRRVPVDALDVVGDRGVAERFLAATSLD